jgi:peptide/nickel transport system permease protein
MNGFLIYAVRRIGSAAFTLLLVSVVIFGAIHWLPGSYADVFLGAHPTPQVKARIEEKFGLDQPLPIQYLKWVSAAARGDFGVSLVTQRTVAEEFGLRLPVTAQLALMALLISLFVGLPVGILGGIGNQRRAVRDLSRLWGSLAMSVPDFVIGSLLVYVVARYPLGLTIGSWVSPGTDLSRSIQATALPACTLAALGVGFVMTTARHATISVRSAPWIMAAVARGKSTPAIVREHVIRNVSIPVVTIVAIYLGYLLGGTAIVESLFTMPGVGRYIVQAVELRDYPVVQAGVLLAASVFMILNVTADLFYAALDPRIRT